LTGKGSKAAPLGVNVNRRVLKRIWASAGEWWKAVPWALWGTAAVAFNTRSVGHILHALRVRPVGAADGLLLDAFAAGEIDIAISRRHIFFPRNDSEQTSTIEAQVLA
jgi:hypothetical protein